MSNVDSVNYYDNNYVKITMPTRRPWRCIGVAFEGGIEKFYYVDSVNYSGGGSHYTKLFRRRKKKS